MNEGLLERFYIRGKEASNIIKLTEFGVDLISVLSESERTEIRQIEKTLERLATGETREGPEINLNVLSESCRKEFVDLYDRYIELEKKAKEAVRDVKRSKNCLEEWQPSESLKEVSSKGEALYSEHLTPGVSPILVCVGTPEQFKRNGFVEWLRENDRQLQNVDYKGDAEELRNRGFRKDQRSSYVISPIDESNKFSDGLFDCTGVVVSGEDKETGKYISFLSHQDPKYFLNHSGNYGTASQEKFSEDLTERLRDMENRCVDGTIDAIIFGGSYDGGSWVVDFSKTASRYRFNYLESIKLLSEKISGVLGFKPVIATGPKEVCGADNVFYDNGARRLYILRPKVGLKATESYSPTSLEQKRKDW